MMNKELGSDTFFCSSFIVPHSSLLFDSPLATVSL